MKTHPMMFHHWKTFSSRCPSLMQGSYSSSCRQSPYNSHLHKGQDSNHHDKRQSHKSQSRNLKIYRNHTLCHTSLNQQRRSHTGMQYQPQNQILPQLDRVHGWMCLQGYHDNHTRNYHGLLSKGNPHHNHSHHHNSHT